jgi:hypothetical protein
LLDPAAIRTQSEFSRWLEATPRHEVAQRDERPGEAALEESDWEVENGIFVDVQREAASMSFALLQSYCRSFTREQWQQ